MTETLLQSQEELLTNVCTTVARQMRHELESEFEQIHKLVTELGKSQSGYSDFMDPDDGPNGAYTQCHDRFF